MGVALPIRYGEDAGGEGLFAALESSRPRLNRILSWFRLPEEDAEDLLQELALTALQKLPEIEDLKAWLPATLHNLCIGHVRRKQRRRFEPLKEFELVCSPLQERLCLSRDALKALALLPQAQQDVLVLRAMGFKASEVACRTGYQTDSIRKLAARGLARLTVRLRSQSEGGAPPIARRELRLRSPSRPEQRGRAGRRSPETKRNYLCRLQFFASWLGPEDANNPVAKLLSLGPVWAQETVIRYRAEPLKRGRTRKPAKGRLVLLRHLVRLEFPITVGAP